LKRISSAFLTTFTLVSRIPVRARFEPDHSWTGLFLPVVGVFAALAAGFGYALGFLVFRDPFVAGAAALVLQYALFNLFHLDGLLDSADAMLCYADREKRLAILKDSRIGSFAFFAGLFCMAIKLYLLWRIPARLLGFRGDQANGRLFTALAEPGRLAALAAFFAYPVVGRAASALVPCFLRPARAEGLGATLAVYPRWKAALGVVFAMAVAAIPAICSGLDPWMLVAAPAGIAIGTLAAALPYGKKIKGFTGDTLGAAVEIGELAYALAFLALLG
jgi:adenosylcobinamide-GDP ribazoletransferase